MNSDIIYNILSNDVFIIDFIIGIIFVKLFFIKLEYRFIVIVEDSGVFFCVMEINIIVIVGKMSFSWLQIDVFFILFMFIILKILILNQKLEKLSYIFEFINLVMDLGNIVYIMVLSQLFLVVYELYFDDLNF